MTVHRTIRVELGSRSYPILIGDGLLAGGTDIGAYMPGRDCTVVSNVTVAPLYLDALRTCLPGREIHEAVLPDGEEHKNLGTVSVVLDRLVADRANRDTTVIALGGGVIGDIAGFAAACYMRGVAFIQVPTTLLSQVDSSVGGKTGVNHPGGKNLVGAFHQPRLVLIDTDTLKTLPDRELSAGLAEVIKHAAIFDRDYFDWIEGNVEALLARDAAALAHAIARSCEIKAAVVSADETEKGQRALLNFGHTFGHAIENSLGYGEWLHGEAVAAGMVMAAELSGISPEEQDRLRRLLAAARLPVEPPRIGSASLREAMRLDKKAAGKRLRFILLDGLGSARIESDVDTGLLDSILARADA